MSQQLEPILEQLGQLHSLATFSPQIHFILLFSYLRLELQSGIFLQVFVTNLCHRQPTEAQ